jgi:hypothetical protein
LSKIQRRSKYFSELRDKRRREDEQRRPAHRALATVTARAGDFSLPAFMIMTAAAARDNVVSIT